MYRNCYYLRIKKRNGNLFYCGNIGGFPVVSVSSGRRIGYAKMKNALATRRKLYNRYGVDFEIMEYGYEIGADGAAYNYIYRTAPYSHGFGNEPSREYRARKMTVYRKLARGHAVH